MAGNKKPRIEYGVYFHNEKYPGWGIFIFTF